MKGPMLIAANHPDGFLDAIILDTLFKEPVHSLTRGDAFANKFYSKLLRSLNMLPVYRISEGADNVERNYSTFDECLDIFKKGGIVLIFSEGESINDWRLRPLKKGTARLAMTAWEQGIPLKVLPTGINYSSFKSFGKKIEVKFGDIISAGDIKMVSQGAAIAEFNALLFQRLEKLICQKRINPEDQYRKLFVDSTPIWKKAILAIPAGMGWLIHLPLYYASRALIKKKDDDLYDSILLGLLFVFYPFYLLIISLITYLLYRKTYIWALMIIIPFTGWAYLQLKKTGKTLYNG
jgi:1-acyl-sn-glycerol-3-phosphate acyltransferase